MHGWLMKLRHPVYKHMFRPLQGSVLARKMASSKELVNSWLRRKTLAYYCTFVITMLIYQQQLLISRHITIWAAPVSYQWYRCGTPAMNWWTLAFFILLLLTISTLVFIAWLECRNWAKLNCANMAVFCELARFGCMGIYTMVVTETSRAKPS